MAHRQRHVYAKMGCGYFSMTNKSGKNGRKPLTNRQRKMVKELAKGQSRTQAYLDANYSPNRKSAPQGAFRALQQIKKKMPHLMDDKGLTDDALIEEYLLSLRKAKRVQAFSNNGQVIYSKPLEALEIRLRALELAFKLKGSFPTADQQQANVGVRVILMDSRSQFIHNNGDEDDE
jgi:hypothetical protein